MKIKPNIHFIQPYFVAVLFFAGKRKGTTDTNFSCIERRQYRLHLASSSVRHVGTTDRRKLIITSLLVPPVVVIYLPRGVPNFTKICSQDESCGRKGKVVSVIN
jgi:hypothetical protein